MATALLKGGGQGAAGDRQCTVTAEGPQVSWGSGVEGPGPLFHVTERLGCVRRARPSGGRNVMGAGQGFF